MNHASDCAPHNATATRDLFEAHVKGIEAKALSGDADAIKTLACMAMLVEGFPPNDGEGLSIIDIDAWRVRLAA